jgi:hypothetical protein
MALKPITLRLDEEEYEKLKEHLGTFGDPDINVAYVLRAYIRDLNRVLPHLVKTEWDLKNYFGFIGFWLKQSVSMSDTEMFSKMMVNPWSFWNPSGAPRDRGADRAGSTERKGHRDASRKEGGDTEE